MKEKVLVLGYGRSGKAAERLLVKHGFSVTVWDEKNKEHPKPENLDVFSFAVLSPGIPYESAPVEACTAVGVQVMGELALAARYWKGRVAAVTGSKGKSSIVKLIADTMKLAGIDATACGNYGLPFSEVAEREHTEESWAVVEVSSFQMESVSGDSFRPEIATVINLQEDHIDRHGSVAEYHALKMKLLRCAPVAVIPEGCTACSAAGVYVPVEALIPEILVAPPVDPSIACGSYFDNKILHKNLSCAVAVMKYAGLCSEAVRKGLECFEPLPHRMCKICVNKGVEYVDDSKATSVSALAAAIEMTPDGMDVRLIAGGLAKGDDVKSVKFLLSNRVKKVYLIGCCAKQFFDAWNDCVPCEIYGTIDCAFEAVVRDACVGERVLLSPGAASFDQFESYGERGDVFAGLVRSRLEEASSLTD